jgi:sec-independent protein translocase protein TatA
MFPQLGFMEMLVVMGLAVLLFGKRLPEVGRSLGRGIVEFKKGLNGANEDFDLHSPSDHSSSYGSARRSGDRAGGETLSSDESVPKFEVPGEPSTVAMSLEAPRPPAD